MIKTMAVLNYLVLLVNLWFLICHVFNGNLTLALISLIGLACCVRSVLVVREILK